MKFKAYPMFFTPILKEKVWGGKNLKDYMDIKSDITGEAWTLADQTRNNSVISNGAYKGRNLRSVINDFPEQMLGRKILKKYGPKFPLLFKFLDTNDRLSVQVHPDDAYARGRGFEAGKTEMWYVLRNKFRSSLLLGLKEKINVKELEKRAKKGGLDKKLKKYRTKKGDCFFIPAGTIHTIGKGNLILEIQQNSDITYRLYDWGRQNLKDDRQLNIHDALNSLKNTPGSGRVETHFAVIETGMQRRPLVECGYFKVNELKVEKGFKYWYNEKKSAVINIIEGELEIQSMDGGTYRLKTGFTTLLPYDLTGFLIKAKERTDFLITEVV